MNKLLETAHKELRKLLQSTPTWDNYEKIGMLYTSIQCLEKNICVSSGEIGELIYDMRDNFGDTRTLDVLADVLADFKKDMDCISPHLSVCLINKIKERIR